MSFRFHRLLSLFAVCAAGCGYRWGLDYPDLRRPVIQVPYAKGDDDGSFTAALSCALTASGLVDVSQENFDYRLVVSLEQTVDEQIGYRRDPQKIKNKIKKNILASEGRRTLHATATLYRGKSEDVISGPHQITSDADYDYVDGDSYPQLTFQSAAGQTVIVLPFSLGQLESVESAQEACARPVYKRAAQKIVDAISAEW